MFRRRWWVGQWVRDPHARTSWPEVIDGPFRFHWRAEAAASSHRAHEAQRARVEGDAMRRIDVMEAVTSGTRIREEEL